MKMPEQAVIDMKKINGIPAHPTDKAARHLHELAQELVTIGAYITYEPGELPRLLVRNPRSEKRPRAIYAATDKLPDGTREWWYWWRLIDKIAKVDDVVGAAKIVAEALDIRTSS